jgi:hypothetical protein
LDLPVEDVDLGPNLVGNGGFEEWLETRPVGWIWSDMFNRDPFNAALFVGGCESMFSLDESCAASILGLWIESNADRSPARAGYWYWKNEDLSWRNPIELTVQTPYMIGFYYRTERVTGKSRGASAWLSETDTLWSHDHSLSSTDGAWRRFVAAGWVEAEDTGVSPLLRSFNSGRVQFDDVQLREIMLADEGHPKYYGETQYYYSFLNSWGGLEQCEN